MCIGRRCTHEGEVGGQGHAGVGDLVHGGQLSASPHCLYLFLHRHLHTHIRNVMYTHTNTQRNVCLQYCTGEHHDVLPMCMCVCAYVCVCVCVCVFAKYLKALQSSLELVLVG